MNSSIINDGAVYVDISTMNTWMGNITEISTTNASILTELSSIINSLEGSWEGNSATAFANECSGFIKNLTLANNRFAEFSKLLETVVQTMESE